MLLLPRLALRRKALRENRSWPVSVVARLRKWQKALV